MKILVTGGAGYIGSVVVRELLRGRHKIWVLDNYTTGHGECRKALRGPHLTWVEGDVGQSRTLRKLLAGQHIDACVHMAGSIRVEESLRRPELYYRNNLAAGINLLEVLGEAGVFKFVFSSTAAVYGVPSTIPIPEDHPTNPASPYGETKLAFERALHWFRGASGLRFLALRYFNAAGATEDATLGESHDPETHLIPVLLHAAASGTPVAVFGSDYPTPDGTCVRDFVHVEDLAAAHRLAVELLEREDRGEALNIGTGRGYSVRQVLGAVEEVTGKNLIVQTRPRRAGDPPVLVAAIDRARRILGWEPRESSLGRIVATAWEWHRRRFTG